MPFVFQIKYSFIMIFWTYEYGLSGQNSSYKEGWQAGRWTVKK